MNNVDDSGHAILQHVRILDIKEVGLLCTDEELGPIVVCALRRCTQLYELRIRRAPAVPLSDTTMDELRSLQLPQLRSLRLRGKVQSIYLYQFISTLPQLQFLSIESEFSRPPPPGLSCTACFYEIRIWRTLPPYLLEWLLKPSKGHLEIFELRDVPGVALKEILRPHCSTIRSLRLMPFNHISVEIVKMCTQLEELTTMNIPTVFRLPPLPPTFRHLCIYLLNTHHRTSVSPIIKVLQDTPSMKSIRCNSLAANIRDFELLAEECKKHEVELELGGTDSSQWPSDDCVKATSFPRRRSVANLKRMNM